MVGVEQRTAGLASYLLQTIIRFSDSKPLSLVPLELLSQLSGVRRSAGGQLSSGPSASQLQQLQMQLHHQCSVPNFNDKQRV